MAPPLAVATLRWEGLSLQLLPDRAVWEPQQRLLLVADLHLGKAECFQSQGIPLPSDGDAATFNRLLALAHHWRPERLVVLGDLIHGAAGLTGELRQKLEALPDLLGCPLQLIGGNHERGSWLGSLAQEPPQAAGGLWLSHEPQLRPGLLNLCGHLHPVTVVGRGADRLRLPCFAYDPSGAQLQLPAFGELTGGHPCAPHLQRWLISGNQLLAWPGERPSSGRRGPAPHRRG